MEKNSSKIELTVPQSILLGFCIVAAAIFFGIWKIGGTLSSNSQATPTNVSENETPGTPPVIDIAKINVEGEPFIGNPTPKVAVAYWCDYQASLCKQFETGTFQKLIEKYVAGDTGIAVIFKDLPLFGKDSMTAALYGRAVWDLYPGQYYAWREAMFTAQDRVEQGFGDEESIKQLTGTITGIDAEKISIAIKQKKDIYQKAIDADIAEANKYMITGNPSFITGATKFIGNVSFAEFSENLDYQLKIVGAK
ncbi:MAG: thioredoxin domain-containing protein [Candidatus Pacebacteria bacterium]|nr:thioredoxin domain-containing protein [Candidatus Paceibacterota bacterium]